MNSPEKIAFIYKAIDDTTNTSRFLDTKVGAIFVIIGVTSTFMGSMSNCMAKSLYDFKDLSFISYIILFFIIMYFFTTTMTVCCAAKVLKPKNTPKDHVNYGSINPDDLWSLTNDSNGNISISLEDYANKVDALTEKDLIIAVSFKLMKARYIKNIKVYWTDKTFFWFICSIFIFLIILVLIYFYNLYMLNSFFI